MNITRLLRISPTVEFLAQMLSGALVYYVGVGLYAYFSNSRYAELPTDEPVLWLMIYTAVTFPLLVIGWNRVNQNYRVVINLPLGILLLLPPYFSLHSADSLSEVIQATISSYSMLPLMLLSIQLTPMGWAFDIAVVATLLTSGLLDTRYILKNS
jgi:hypothetical protein